MMNLADPKLELLDPTPNIHSMFLNFDQTFFWSELSSRCIVRWSKRMYSSAGVTTYEGRRGICHIALSEPLLKLRPRKDLVETLLHEMIHAYLFVINMDQDRDGHGPNFQAHMHRINTVAGLNISIYHDFHDEVELYQIHWWRCNGPCQRQKPHFGIVRRSCNRAPGKWDYWWKSHKKDCGGTFIKIKEPEKPEKKDKNNKISKPNTNITNNNSKEVSNKNIIKGNKSITSVLKGRSNTPVKPKPNTNTKSNKGTITTSIKKPICNPQVPNPKPMNTNATSLANSKGETINDKHTNNSVTITVRSVWGNKQINTLKTKDTNNSATPVKHKADNHIEAPPSKMKKIDDYFKSSATSVLKNIYGQVFDLTQPKSDEKIKVVPKTNNSVDCPVCNIKIDSCEINKHLDECLNKDLIVKLANKSVPVGNESKVDSDQNDKIKPKGISRIEIINPDARKTEQNSSNKKGCKATNEENLNKNIVVEITPKRSDNNGNHRRIRKSLDIGDLRTNKEINVKEKKIPNFRQSDGFMGSTLTTTQITLTPPIQPVPGCSKSDATAMACPCCGKKLNKSVDEHLDECLAFENNTTLPHEGPSTSNAGEIIIINDSDDEDDKFDESQLFNASGTKYPCPCCLQMVEETKMNSHLDECLS